MASFLAIDTATPACSAAVSVNQKCIADFVLEPQSHTRLILPMIDKLLTEAEITVSDLDAIVFTHGPGSFTGIRIGFGVVQGLALGARLPVIPVSTLKLMAGTAKRMLLLDDGVQVLPSLDARMNELYCGNYLVGKHQPQKLADDHLSSPEEAFKSIARNEFIVGVGDGWRLIPHADQLTDQLHVDVYPQAEDLLAIAEDEFRAGNTKPIEGLEPLYIRDTVSWKKRQRLREG